MRLLIRVEILACRGRFDSSLSAGQNHDLTQVDTRSGTTWAVAPLADSLAQIFGVSSRPSLCRQPQTIAETRGPTVRRPSPRRRVAQPGLSRRIGAAQTMGGAVLSRDR